MESRFQGYFICGNQRQWMAIDGKIMQQIDEKA